MNRCLVEDVVISPKMPLTSSSQAPFQEVKPVAVMKLEKT